MRLTVSAGIAKPIPMLPLDGEIIWALMPITCPELFSSGPPELPGLIAASVWMMFSMIRPFSARIERPVALIMPVVSVRS